MTEKKLKPSAKKTTTSKTSATIKSTATKKPAAKKTVPKKSASSATKTTKASAVKKAETSHAEKIASAKKVPVAKAATSMSKPAPSEKAIAYPTPEERYRMVETAAYFIAEQHGFQGRSDEHWAAAEREIAARLGNLQR